MIIAVYQILYDIFNQDRNPSGLFFLIFLKLDFSVEVNL